MPTYKDEERKTWYCKFNYKDWTGQNKQKLKRGFKREKDAKEWERDFLSKQQADQTMTFQTLVDLYFEDMGSRLRKSTIESKKHAIDSKILPYFKDKPINEIKPTDIRKWQNDILEQNYAPTYQKKINNTLTIILNFAVRYYGLKENPCKKAGSIGKTKAEAFDFWTKEEFKTFIACINNPSGYAALNTLYWTGIRVGELFAITPSDIDFDNKVLTINKSLQRIGGKDIVTAPKTPKSNRLITIPDFLNNILKNYLDMLYDLKPTDRIFPFTKSFLYNEIKRGSKASGIRTIKIHELRHSHASLLIELGFSPLLIAERLGHEKVETTLNTYSHLYPSKHEEVASKLNELVSK
ncbi:site-specific integrase [Anaerocolumna aminovalerica]|uniref:Site-specific recombinase XerD n=1 Tax=Anaerocolumna aminovalerica TaxID=1527 RepID=A0A1I5IYW9_9FIRM|nr:site-specific integrase [Anaerocolumna aminovalerica]SFO65550.1 Site-specific recombinase XerD [Anaerocolumna aminovalerica]